MHLNSGHFPLINGSPPGQDSTAEKRKINEYRKGLGTEVWSGTDNQVQYAQTHETPQTTNIKHKKRHDEEREEATTGT